MTTTTLTSESGVGLSQTGFTIVVHEAGEGESGFWGEVFELPGCLSQGETIEELIANLQEAMEAIREYSTSSNPPVDSFFGIWPTAGTFTA